MEYVKILVAVISHNAADSIEKTVISLFKQDYPAIRSIIVDDCSSDKTIEIITKYRDKMQIIRNEKNSGFSYSLNRALSMTKEEEILFILQDDIELIDSDYISHAVKHFENNRVALVCGQATGFTSDRLSLVKRFFARFFYQDYGHQEDGATEVSDSFLKADFIRVAPLRLVGGFSYAGNPKAGSEDHILAKRLRERGFILVKDTRLKYYFDYARSVTLRGLLKCESNYGRTLGVAVIQGLISINPNTDAETRRKSNYRRTQVIIVALVFLSFFLFVYSWKLALVVLAGLLALEFVNYLRKSNGFRGWEKLYFGLIGLINDFVFSISFYWGVVQSLKTRYWPQSKHSVEQSKS